MPSYKLIYFNARGRAEPSRIAFAYSGIEYEDVRLERESWPDYKKEAPFGSAPYLKVDDTIISDSAAILKYVAQLGGMIPETPLKEAQANMIFGGIGDAQTKMVKVFFELDEAKKAELQKELYESTLPQLFSNLEKVMKSCGGEDFFIDNKISFVDIEFFNLVNSWLGQGKREVPECLKGFEALIRVYEAVASKEKIAEWLEKRPNTEF